MMSRPVEKDVKARTSVIEKWLREGEVGKNPSNGVVATAQPSLFNPLRRGNDDRLARVSSFELSPSSSSSNGFAANFSDLTSSPPNPRPGGSHIAGDDLGLTHSFRRLTIRGNNNNDNNRPEQRTATRVFGVDSDNGVGFGFGFGFGLDRDFENPGVYEGSNGSDGDVVRSTWLGLGHNNVGDSRDSIGSPLTHTSLGSRNSSPTFANTTTTTTNNSNNSQMGYYNDSREVQLQTPIGGPFTGDDPVWSPPSSNGLRGVTHSTCLLERWRRNLAAGLYGPLHDDRPSERARVTPPGGVTPVFRYNQALGSYEPLSCEDSFIIEGSPAINERRDCSLNSQRNGFWNPNAWSGGFNGLSCRYTNGGVAESRLSGMTFEQRLFLRKFRAMAMSEGFVYLMAKDQSGCRTLQKVFDEGTCDDVKLIFDGVISHIVELSTDPFGNYLVQKLLDVCTREQRRQIVYVMTMELGELLTISLNTHGTRVVQKLIETSKDWRCISLLTMTLKPGILDLIKDLNGNHVLQSCLKCLRSEENAFIFDAATRFCVEIATHRHGCCVMQKCIERSTGHYRYKLLAEILKHALLLAADPYGNYVIQFIMDQNIQSFTSLLISHFKGHYVRLSTLKCGSHVVEKFLKEVPESRQRIVQELLNSPQFEDLLQDPFANYVIQSALNVTKGSILNDSLVRRVRPHSQALQASPYCKKILLQTMPRR